MTTTTVEFIRTARGKRTPAEILTQVLREVPYCGLAGWITPGRFEDLRPLAVEHADAVKAVETAALPLPGRLRQLDTAAAAFARALDAWRRPVHLAFRTGAAVPPEPPRDEVRAAQAELERCWSRIDLAFGDLAFVVERVSGVADSHYREHLARQAAGGVYSIAGSMFEACHDGTLSWDLDALRGQVARVRPLLEPQILLPQGPLLDWVLSNPAT